MGDLAFDCELCRLRRTLSPRQATSVPTAIIVSPSSPKTILNISTGVYQQRFVLGVGDYQDFSFRHSTTRDLRVVLADIRNETLTVSFLDQQLEVLCGCLQIESLSDVFPGPETRRLANGQFAVPSGGRSGPLRSVYHFDRPPYFNFFRISVDHINQVTREATLDMLAVLAD